MASDTPTGLVKDTGLHRLTCLGVKAGDADLFRRRVFARRKSTLDEKSCVNESRSLIRASKSQTSSQRGALWVTAATLEGDQRHSSEASLAATRISVLASNSRKAVSCTREAQKLPMTMPDSEPIKNTPLKS